MAKKMPADTDAGGERIFYEVTASGVDRYRSHDWPNSNRVRLRSADTQGNAIFHRECKFPFTYGKKAYNDCTADDNPMGTGRGRKWCAFAPEGNLSEEPGRWGFCLNEEEELVPRDRQTVEGLTCSDDYHHTCGVRAVYGGLSVDWEAGELTLSVFKKDTKEDGYSMGLSSSVRIDINAPPPATRAPSATAAPSSPPPGSCEDELRSLPTGADCDDSVWGVMFDVTATAGDADVLITGLNITMKEVLDSTIVVYTRPGSHRGHGEEVFGWEHVGTYSALTHGKNNHTPFEFGSGGAVQIGGGTTRAFYVAQTNSGNICREKVGYEVADQHLLISGATRLSGGDEVPFSGSAKFGYGFVGGVSYRLCELSTLSPTRSPVTGVPTVTPRPTVTGSPVTPLPTVDTCMDDNLSLSTGFADTDEDNEGEGIFFDVEARGGIEIYGFDINVEKEESLTFKVYTRPGTHVSFEDSPVDWEYLDKYVLQGQGEGNATPLILRWKIRVSPGNRQAFYIAQLNDDDLLWYDRKDKDVGDVDVMDTYITLLVGTAKVGLCCTPFEQENVPRKGFSGRVLYQSCPGGSRAPSTLPVTSSPTVDTCVDDDLSLSTGFDDTDEANEGEGMFFDVEARDAWNVGIYGFDINVEKENTLTFEVYTRLGTHVGFEDSAVGWETLGTYSLQGQGEGNATPLILGKKIMVGSSNRRAIYIAQLNDDDLLWYDRSDKEVGNIDVMDNYIKLLVGTAKKGDCCNPFEQKNVPSKGFSGTVLYQTCPVESLAPSVSPVPSASNIPSSSPLSFIDLGCWTNPVTGP